MEIENLARLIGSLVVVIALMLLLLNFIKRKSQVLNGSLKIESMLNLGPKEKILLVQYGENRVLVGATSSSMTTLMVERSDSTVLADEEAHEEQKIKELSREVH